jgi:hypothetical protein
LGSFMMARKLSFVICKARYVSISWARYDRCVWYSRECKRNWIYGHTKCRDEKTKQNWVPTLVILCCIDQLLCIDKSTCRSRILYIHCCGPVD